jgi:hypothetical protein
MWRQVGEGLKIPVLSSLLFTMKSAVVIGQAGIFLELLACQFYRYAVNCNLLYIVCVDAHF